MIPPLCRIRVPPTYRPATQRLPAGDSPGACRKKERRGQMSSPPTSDRAVQVQADCEKPGMVALLHLIDKRNKNKSKNSQKKKQGFHDDPPSDDIGLCIGNLFGKTVCPPGLPHILSKSVPEIPVPLSGAVAQGGRAYKPSCISCRMATKNRAKMVRRKSSGFMAILPVV